TWDIPAPSAAASAEWDAAPPPAPAAPDWSGPPPAAADGDWSAPAPPPPSAPSWKSAPVGASALEQMDSEPQEYEASPEAAKDLFGAPGSMSSGDEDHIGPPEKLASPEAFLKPVEHDDPNLLVPVEEPPPPPKAAIAAFKPIGLGALVVEGEHRVAVHTRGGRTRRGSIKDIDLSKSQFPLLPQGGGAAEPVYHAEVKAVFFMLAPGEKLGNPEGGKVRVTFADGRTIEGHRDGPDAKHGFFLIPLDAAKTNTRRIYIARDACSEIKDG
ncbi:MAG: hypothetical protein LC689_03020, partial [Myxococcales bacterium]|nr:hypothetical protein [Myxococcales bacterium]